MNQDNVDGVMMRRKKKMKMKLAVEEGKEGEAIILSSG